MYFIRLCVRLKKWLLGNSGESAEFVIRHSFRAKRVWGRRVQHPDVPSVFLFWSFVRGRVVGNNNAPYRISDAASVFSIKTIIINYTHFTLIVFVVVMSRYDFVFSIFDIENCVFKIDWYFGWKNDISKKIISVSKDKLRLWTYKKNK